MKGIQHREGEVERPLGADLPRCRVHVEIAGGPRGEDRVVRRGQRVVDARVVAVAHLDRETLGQFRFGDDRLADVLKVKGLVGTEESVGLREIDEAVGQRERVRKSRNVARALVVHPLAGGQQLGERRAHDARVGIGGVADQVAPLATDLEVFPGPNGRREGQAFVQLAVGRAKIFRVTVDRVDAEAPILEAGAGIEGVAAAAFGVSAGGEGAPHRTTQSGTLRVGGDHAAGIAGAEEQRVGAAERVDALDVEGVHQRRVGPEETVAPRVVDRQSAHGHALRVLPVSVQVAANFLVTASDNGGAETAELGEHLGHVDHGHLVHELPVKYLGIEGGLAE